MTTNVKGFGGLSRDQYIDSIIRIASQDYKERKLYGDQEVIDRLGLDYCDLLNIINYSQLHTDSPESDVNGEMFSYDWQSGYIGHICSDGSVETIAQTFPEDGIEELK